MKGQYTFMFRSLVVTLGLLFSISAFSQNAIKQNVEKYLRSNVEFKEFEPFKQEVAKGTTALRSLELEHSLTEGSILFLTEEKTNDLRAGLGDFLRLELPGEEENLGILIYRQSIFTPDAIIADSDYPDMDFPLPEASFYRGIVEGKEHSLVALTVFNDEISGLVSYGTETYVLGKIKDAKNGEHIWYKDDDLLIDEGFSCNAIPSDDHDTDYKGSGEATQKTNNCVRLRIEIDSDIVSDFGSASAATNYASSLFNQVVTLFANDDIDIAVSEIFAWSGSSPYSGDVENRLVQMSNNSSNADLTQLLTGVSISGIAYLSGLCSTNFGVSVAGIFGFFNAIPSYSWDVNVTAHEVGHNLSSEHTHACAWNGNNTAIDGCGFNAGFSEGCTGPIPPNGGTIMSYCHLLSTGVNFNLGFGPQPTARMTNYINSRPCLEPTCGSAPPVDCDFESLSLVINTDQYPGETTWEITNGSGSVVSSGGPYSVQFSTVVENICLEEGCYTLTFFDSFGDGICCGFGSGSYTLTYEGNLLASGGEFNDIETSEFCVTQPSSPCDAINFNEVTLGSYVPSRDVGNFEIQDNGATIFLQDNALKFIPLGYDVTPNTILTFDFKSTEIGSLHGIGFDNNAALTLPGIFQLYGTLFNNQLRDEYYNYPGDGQWQSYVIPVGEFFTFPNLNLTVMAVNANGSPGNNSYFRNIKLYEDGECTGSNPGAEPQALKQGMGYGLFPNPTRSTAELWTTGDLEIATFSVFSLSGGMISQKQVNGTRATIDLSDLSQGVYLVQWTDNFGVVHRDKLIKAE